MDSASQTDVCYQFAAGNLQSVAHPILDGGVILLLLIEGTIRRDISLPVKERIYQAAFVFLILFATVVIYNDISKLIAGRQLP